MVSCKETVVTEDECRGTICVAKEVTKVPEVGVCDASVFSAVTDGEHKDVSDERDRKRDVSCCEWSEEVHVEHVFDSALSALPDCSLEKPLKEGKRHSCLIDEGKVSTLSCLRAVLAVNGEWITDLSERSGDEGRVVSKVEHPLMSDSLVLSCVV